MNSEIGFTEEYSKYLTTVLIVDPESSTTENGEAITGETIPIRLGNPPMADDLADWLERLAGHIRKEHSGKVVRICMLEESDPDDLYKERLPANPTMDLPDGGQVSIVPYPEVGE